MAPDMTAPAQGLQIAELERIAARVERLDVVRFEPAGRTAIAAPPAVALEHGPSHPRPTPLIERGHGGVNPDGADSPDRTAIDQTATRRPPGPLDRTGREHQCSRHVVARLAV